MAVAKTDPEREERRREQTEIAESLKASGALNDIFARIDAGEPLTGHAGLLKGMLKATLERHSPDRPDPQPRARPRSAAASPRRHRHRGAGHREAAPTAC